MMVDDKPEADDSERILWLENEIIPRIAKVLDKDPENLRCEIKVPTDSIILSPIYMVELSFCCRGGAENERLRLVIKVPSDDESTRVCLRTEIIFHNEMTFYRHFGKNYSDYPKCVLIVSESITRTAIVLENVTQFGYKGIPALEDVGMKRALAAVREIGKFHARGYVLKEKNPKEFFGLREKLRDVYDDFCHPMAKELWNTMPLRLLNYLRSVNYDSKSCDEMFTFMSNSFERIFRDSVKPRNELAVFCHGDFVSNNILSKQEGDDKFKAVLIDFGQFRYASPATDLSTYLCVSCEDDVRINFSVIFKAYHDAVIEYLEEQDIQDLEKYSYDAFLKDYKRHAIIGFGIAAFFIPYMNLGYYLSFDELVKNTTGYINVLMASGGDMLTKKLANILLELRDNGCLDHII